MKHPSKLTPMRVAVIISIVVNLTLLAWFLGSDLRHEKVVVIIEPKPELTEEEKNELERKRRDRPVREDEIERVEEFVEKQKLEEMQKHIDALEETKERMEKLVDHKFEALEDFTPEQMEDFHRAAYEVMNAQLLQLRRDMGDNREVIDRDRENRSWQVQRQLRLDDAPEDMEAYQEFFITATEEAAARLRDNPDSLNEEEKAIMEGFADRAEAVADRARYLQEKFKRLEEEGPRGFFEPGPTLAELAPEDRSDMAASDLHEYAKNIESALFQDFAAHQAVDLLSVTRESIVDVLDATAVSPPPRSDLSEPLSRGEAYHGGIESFQNYHQALETAARETAQMRLAGQGRLRNAEARGGGSDGERARALMEARESATGDNMAEGSRGESAGGRGTHGDGSGAAGMGSGPMADVLDARASEMLQERRDETPTLSGAEVIRNAIPGRRFDSNADRQGWVFLDTWYLIGPWERSPGLGFRRPLPPEIEIDFDSTYPGKVVQGEQMLLRWRFLQSNSIQITPYDSTQNAVYFAFTEVYAEEEMDVLLAFGADDEARLWINDVMVYESVGHQAWRMDQNYTRIHLRRGYNSVLVRLENGPDVTHFSVLLTPP